MLSFGIRFFICNIFIAIIISIFLAVKKILKKYLTERVQYNLWFLLLTLLAMPFSPVYIPDVTHFFPWLYQSLQSAAGTTAGGQAAADTAASDAAMNWMNDFSISVSKTTPLSLNRLILIVWLTGMLVMVIVIIKALLHLHQLSQSAQPLESPETHKIFKQCLLEIGLNSNVSLYSTAFLKSPITLGLIHPRIYIPNYLIADFNAKDMRYILLHELQHARHKDALANYLMALVGIVYWFNPLVWYGLREMRNDREIACDSSVLQLLEEKDYEDYGNTLINFAEKLSRTPFPFTAGIGGNIKQIKKRIINIAVYQPRSMSKKITGFCSCILIAVLLLCLAPKLSAFAAEEEHYQFNEAAKNVSYIDLASYFEGYAGSFVLYDTDSDIWQIYDQEHASMRVSPDSTYKLYDALLGLETGIITPEHSVMQWDNISYPFESWNDDQDLNSAMRNSVNWYFQNIDRQAGASVVKQYFQKISYGNQDTSGGLSSYWMESSLKISPIEQVELLRKFYNNAFHISPENIDAVKNSILLSSSANGSLYGKTGSGQVNGRNVNGWFVGYVEQSYHTCFFAVNIQSKDNATGSAAVKIAQAVLNDLDIYKH